MRDTFDREADMGFLKPGILLRGIKCILADNIEENFISNGKCFPKHLPRVFGAVLHASEEAVRRSFIEVAEKEKGNALVRVARVLLVLKMNGQKCGEPVDFAFILLLKCTEQVEKV